MDFYSGLRSFVRVAETESFSACARELGLTTSSVTRLVTGLEDQLGTALLHRSTRKVTLTEAGKNYYSKAKRIMGDIEEANSEAAGLGREPRGVLRITAPIGMGQLRLGPLLPKFSQMYPLIETQVYLTDSYVDLMAESIDVGIRAGKLKDSSYRARKIEDYPRILCASPKYLSSAPPLKKPEDLSDHSCLTYNFQQGQRAWYYKSGGKIKDVLVTGPLHINSLESIINGARSGIGICLTAAWSIVDDLKTGALVPLLPGIQFNVSTVFDESLYAVYLGQNPPPKVRVFVDFVVKEFQK